MRNCPNCNSAARKIKLSEEDYKIVKCGNCGLIYLLNPPDEKEIYEDYYKIDLKAEDYKKNSSVINLAEVFEVNSQRVNFLKKTIKRKEDFKLLDIGCGTGLFLKSCRDSGFNVSGIDVSCNALRFAEENFGLDVSNKSIDALISEGSKYDVITMWHVLEHILNPVEEIKKIKLLLNKEGIFAAEVPNFNSIKFRLSGCKWKGGNHPQYHRSFFTAGSLKETLLKGGFKNIEIKNLSYILQTRGFFYNLSKKVFNRLSADAFLIVIASN